MKPLAVRWLILAVTLAIPVQLRAEPAPQKFAKAVEALERLIDHEVADKQLPALSIILVDDQEVVWSKGFGIANPSTKKAATPQTIYRVGSVSKLFTDIAIMQQVEKGALDLDASVSRYLPGFMPKNPFDKPISLRQLMSHRSGLVREPPVGHYFDPTSPSLRETIQSLNRTELIYPPESRTKYSNAGITVVGAVLERVANAPFASAMRQSVLDPLGMDRSSFSLTPEVERQLASATMWTYHGRTFEAPTFSLGIAPAGNLYAPVSDLGRFLSALFARGKGVRGSILKPETLEQMWTPQLARPGEKPGFGIGFHLTDVDGHRCVGHGGAVYGFATELAALPDDKLGVAVVTTKDCANGVTTRIATDALRQLLAVRQGKPAPVIDLPSPLTAERARRLAGFYGKDDSSVELSADNDRLFLCPPRRETRLELRQLSDALVIDNPISYGQTVRCDGDRVILGNESYVRSHPPKPSPPPPSLAGLIGEYGWDHDILYILEKEGKLHALIEWFFLYPLEDLGGDVYRFPKWGLYDNEKLIFQRDASGRATQVEAASVVFKRRAIDGENGATFRIQAQRPLEELRREALAAQPPKESGDFRKPDLVDVIQLDPTIKLDIRYASTNNFLSTPFYSSARAFLQRPAAEALARVHRKLAEQNFGLLIHDGYRPWYVTKMFWEATPPRSRIFVADPEKGSRHNRGCAVDLTLYDRATGQPITMVGGYDEFSDRSYPEYPGGTSLQRWHRDLLRRSMEVEGFTVYEAEWWHFDYKDWRQYPILNLTFEQLPDSRR